MMSMMEKGFWAVAGGLAGIVLGCMLFDDVELESSRTGRRSAKDGHAVSTEDDEIGTGHSATAERIETTTAGTSETDGQAQDIKAAMDRIGASLGEAMEALKTTKTETTTA